MVTISLMKQRRLPVDNSATPRSSVCAKTVLGKYTIMFFFCRCIHVYIIILS